MTEEDKQQNEDTPNELSETELDGDEDRQNADTTSEDEESPARAPLKSEIRAQRAQESTPTEPDESPNDPPDSDIASSTPELDPVLDSIAEYERSLATKSQSLATALTLYRSQLADGTATHVPPAITPELVSDSLIAGRLRFIQHVFEHLRNAFIFLPVLWTWLQIGLAIRAYNLIKNTTDIAYTQDADTSFLDLWAKGFEQLPADEVYIIDGLTIIKAESFPQTAIIAVGFIAALVVMTFLVGILRSVNTSRVQKIRTDFAGILGQASFLHINITAETPQEQIFEFSRIARQLTGSIQALTTTFQEETSSMSDAIQSAQSSAEQSAEMAKAQFELVNNSVKEMDQAMTTLTSLVDKQATQLGNIVESLSDVSNLADQLTEIRKEFAETTRSLTKIEGELGPAATTLTESATLMNDLIKKIDQASANLGEALLQHDNFSTKLSDAAQSINLVSNRFLDSTDK